MYSKLITIILITLKLQTIFSYKVTNVTGWPLVVLEIGKMKLVEGKYKLVHKIDLEKLNNAVEEIEIASSNHPNLNKLIYLEATDLKNNLARIIPRHFRNKRWDFIGSAFKWIAGSPDADDLRYIEGSIKDLNTQNNIQIKINDQINEKINEMTTTINQLLIQNGKSSPDDVNSITTILNLKQLNEKIQSIKDAIVLANKNIASHRLIEVEEINILANILEQQGIHIQVPEQALDYVETQIGVNKSTLLYILTIPRVRRKTFEMLEFKPLVNNNKTVKLPGKIFARNYPEAYLINKPCKIINRHHICNYKDISNQFNNSCTFNTLFNSVSTCEFKEVKNHEEIIELNPNTILINQANVTIHSDCHYKNKTLIGSYLIQFENCTIIINGRTYSHITLTNVDVPQFKSYMNPRIRKKDMTFRTIAPLTIDKLKPLHGRTDQSKEDMAFEWIKHFGFWILVGIIAALVIVPRQR